MSCSPFLDRPAGRFPGCIGQSGPWSSSARSFSRKVPSAAADRKPVRPADAVSPTHRQRAVIPGSLGLAAAATVRPRCGSPTPIACPGREDRTQGSSVACGHSGGANGLCPADQEIADTRRSDLLLGRPFPAAPRKKPMAHVGGRQAIRDSLVGESDVGSMHDLRQRRSRSAGLS